MNPIRLVLLDLQMPLKSGLDVVQEVRSMFEDYRKQYKGKVFIDPKFAFLTAFSSAALRLYLTKIKVEHCLEKPVNKEQLAELVNLTN